MFTLLPRTLRQPIIAAVVVVACASRTLALNWVSQGPAPAINGGDEGIASADGDNPITGAINAFAVHPTDPNIVYAAGVNGGVWKTVNAKNDPPTWSPISETLPSLSIGTLAINPLDPSILFLGSAATSSLASTGGPLFGVARSTDAGATWNIVAPTQSPVVKVVLTRAANKGSQVVLYASRVDGISRSTDGGATFAAVNAPVLNGVLLDDLVADPGVATRLYASGAGRVFKSDDAGATWSEVSTGTGFTVTGTARVLISVHNSATADVVYAAIIDGGSLANVFRSADQGATWTALNVPTPPIFPGKQGSSQGAIVADKTDPTMVWISGDRQTDATEDGTGGGQFPNKLGATRYTGNVWRNTNGTWESVCANGANGSSPHADSRSLGFDSDGNIIHTCDGGIFKLVNPNGTSPADKSGTRKWVSLNGDMRVLEAHNAVYDPVGRVYLCGAQDNGTNRQRTPAGKIFQEISGGDGGRVEVDADQTAHPGQSIRYDSSQNFGGFQRQTVDAQNTVVTTESPALNIVAGPGTGQTLTKFDKVLFLQPFVLNQIDPKRMLIGTEYIYESLDRGDSLTNLGFASPQGTTNAKAVMLPRNPKLSDMVDNMHVDRDGNALPSDFPDAVGDDVNSGSSAMAYGGRLNGQTFVDVFYTGSNKTIMHRVKLGDALTTLTAYPGDKIRVLVMDPQNYKNVFVLDTTGKVYNSADEGATWTNITANLGNLTTDIRTIEISNPDQSGNKAALYAGGLGGVWRMDKPSATATWVADSAGLPPKVLVYDLRCEVTTNTISAGTLGRGVYGAAITPAAQLLNISTRLKVLANDNVAIAGFIVTGNAGATKKVMIRGLGPSLAAKGVPSPLSDPFLDLRLPNAQPITNDNWQDAPNKGEIPQGFQPADPRESVIITSIPIGANGFAACTCILRGANGETGAGLVEVYDLEAANGQLANISTRGFVDIGDNAMIGGFISGPNTNGSSRIVVRAIGPSLTDSTGQPLAGRLLDPTLSVVNGNGTAVASNDNWKIDDATGQSQEAAITATKLQPSNDAESVVLRTLAPGAYTAIVRGKTDTTGVGLVEVYNLQ